MKKPEKEPTVRSVTIAFKDFFLEASESELYDAVKLMGLNPATLIAEANAAIGAALKPTLKDKLSEAERAKTDTQIKLALHQGLSALIRLLRRQKGLSEFELAEEAGIDVAEIQRIECDDTYTPSPRTIYQLEEYFSLPARSLVLMSGAVITSHTFYDQVIQFAAHAKDIGKLSREEKKLLNEFVRFLADEQKKHGK